MQIATASVVPAITVKLVDSSFISKFCFEFFDRALNLTASTGINSIPETLLLPAGELFLQLPVLINNNKY
jgi:hypothetical protein